MQSIDRALDRVQMAVKAERASRLGLLASLALGRFVALYHKYSEDQPRDDHGRWTDTGAARDVDETGSVTPIRNNAKTGDVEIDSITAKLAQKLADIVDAVGPGSGPLYGIKVHSAFAEAVRASGIPNLEAETTWFDGLSTLRYGFTGSIRTDVALRGSDDSGPVRAVWDAKTGNTTLGPARLDQLRAKIGIGQGVPIIELNVNEGVMIKAMVLVRQGRGIHNGEA